MRHLHIEDLDHFFDLDAANRLLVTFNCPVCGRSVGKRADLLHDGDEIVCRCGQFSLTVSGEGFRILQDQIGEYSRLWNLK